MQGLLPPYKNFGDDWRFSCKVLRIEEERCGEPEIIRVAGEAPEQYPDYDEYDEDAESE